MFTSLPYLVNLTFHFLCFFLCFFISSSTVLASDYEALLTLKQGFNNSNPSLKNWDSSNSTSFCFWTGVKCLHGRVISLDLTDFHLEGSISPVFSTLDSLIHLSLAGNNFSGRIEIDNLSSLRFLNLSNNVFNGGMDEWNLSSLPNLEVLDVYNNEFKSPLPMMGMSSYRKLRHLDLGGNFFYGEIPSSYGELISLEYMSLGGNDLHGTIPKELGNLTNLRELYLGQYNVYEGGIPKEFGKLVNLVHLDVSSCGLSGSIPKELGNMRLIDTLYLHMNHFSGGIPRELGNLTNLVNLDLSINALSGEIPHEFVNLKKLKLLNLFMNKLHGSIPDYVADDLDDLETLELWKNNFTGEIPRNLGQNGKIQVLDLSSNKLTGTIPSNLCASTQLSVLILMNNFLFGPIPDSLGSCISLIRVRLGQNYLNGSVPNGLIYLPQLNLLELQNNYLSGNLPENVNPSLLNPVKLDQLDISNNLLSGILPVSISNFTSIQSLYLEGNQFSGPIPQSIGQLKQVIKLDLSKNFLSGLIPPEIGNCAHLTYLDLSQNNLSGSIPPEISGVKIISYLNVSRNHLNGTLPMSLGSMKSLTSVDFSFNELSGKLPESGQFSVFNASSFVGNPLLCGSLLNNPCNLTQVLQSPNKKSSSGQFKLIFALVLLVCSLIFAGAAVIKAKSFKKSSDSWKLTTFQKVDFTILDILECMKDGNVIGRGGAGIVYHGKMPCGSEIAVKKLLGFGPNRHDHGFKAEIETLGQIRHRNIVRLLAFCTNKHTNLLVYEYMRNGSLGEALHGKKLGGFLGWNMRYKIAIEASKGLCYLHHDCSPLIVHRDVKSNNILLNSNFEAHVADFGLAKFLADGGASECMSAIAGSYGYIAPEYAYTLRVDEKSDVYSFGVVLLELLTGRRPVGDFGEGVDIVQWSRVQTNCRKETVPIILDSRLTTVPQDEAMHLFFVAMLCTQENSIERPTMREVVQMLSEYPYHAMGHQNAPSSSLLNNNINNNNNNTKQQPNNDAKKG
ncbi:leucine-rich repeat receptor-like serine/threonine-protein kinase BAM1 [Beta vulgaris subsp. vulgaris]|uniref:leucine-rich repeat receptor-like serine/threonine-protein kinase BAM1 n=1 Tax=Beta vulgaris subsp. vulgaris TaxID=3555 RepID=UPI0020371AAF|nr:leucine-rich repeat receptor-like serine/threonine-protein kinase BAM1 [Beta vulgaris subsp. vulgaris]